MLSAQVAMKPSLSNGKESLKASISYKEKAQAYQAIDKDYQEAQKQMFDLMDHLKSKDARRQV